MRIIVFFLLFVEMCISERAWSQSGFSIKGNLENAESLKVYLTQRGGALATGTETLLLDSVVVANGQFKLQGRIEEPGYYSIIVESKRGWKPFLLENKEYEITGDADAIWKAEVDGSDEISIKKEYAERVNPLITKMNIAGDSLQVMFGRGDTSLARVYAEQNMFYSKQIKLVAKDIILKYPEAYTSLFLFPELEGVLNMEEQQQLYEKLSDGLKQHSFAKHLYYELYELHDLIRIGKEAIPISLQDQFGNAVSLKDFQGKYVLIDFWASWCGPCRADHPSLIELYEQYHSKGLEILSISIDHKIEHWKRAIAEDKLPWPNVLDLKNGQNEVASQYGIKVVPSNFLLDKSGILIAKDLDRAALEKKLRELLGF
ncbi:MAG: TlpA disulfide reductase family protein [Saprospiraceae bacterium]